MSYKPRRRILPRSERPEILALGDRRRARREWRYICRHTNLPVGQKLLLDTILIGNVLKAQAQMAREEWGQMSDGAELGEEIFPDAKPEEIDALFVRLGGPFSSPVVFDEEFILKLNEEATWLAFECFLARNLAIEDTKSANGIHWRANAKLESGDIAGALSDYSQAIEMETDEPLYWQSRAQLYTEQKCYAEAAIDLLQAERLSRDVLDLYDLRSKLCLAWVKLESVSDLLVAADLFSQTVGYITFNTAWQPDGYGWLASNHFPGVRILERIQEVRQLLQITLGNLVEPEMRKHFENIHAKLGELESLY